MGNIVEIFRQRIWLGLLLGAVIGLAIGMLLGWVVWPVSWTPGADDVAAVADSFALNGNVDLAKKRLEALPKADQERIISGLIRDRQSKNLSIEAERLTALRQALNLSAAPQPAGAGTPAPTGQAPRPATTPGGSGALTDLLIPILIGVFVLGVLALAGVLFVTKVLPGMRARSAERPAPAVAIPGASAPISVSPEAISQPSAAGGLGRFVPSYTLGNDNYDTSYSLETPRGEFLGECGMGISERIGEGKPDKVTAFDLWLFDKADVRTVTQILMSEYAFKDQNLRAKLATKGEAVQAEKGKVLRLETQSLGITAHIVELVYATNANFPPNSHFQKLIIEIVPEFKTVAAAR